MKKVLVLIVALALIWAIPPVRARLATALLPVLEKLGPVGAKVINPARNYATRNKTTQFGRLLKNDATEGRPLPEPATFQAWLDRKMSAQNVRDPWDQPYWLQRSGPRATIGSNGADGVRGTADDIIETVQF